MDWLEMLKTLTNFGAAGLIIWFVWRITDKWAGLFLAAQGEQTKAMSHQAEAMAALATAVKDGQSDQREVLLAVRVQSRQIEELKGLIVEAIGEKRTVGGTV